MRYVRLETLCTMQSGGTPSRANPEFYDGDIPWAKISDLEKTADGYISSTEESISKVGLRSINNRFFKPNTLLLAMYGSVGKSAISKISLSTNQAILGINIIDENVLDLKYLKYWFTEIKEKLLDRAVGVALQNISLGIVKSLEIPLPPLKEQKKIAAILDAADALRQKDKAIIAKYDQLTQALFLDMFGDPVSNAKGWDKRTLKECTSKIGSGSTPRGGKGSYQTSGISLIRSMNVYDNEFLYKDLAYIDEVQAKKLQNVEVYRNDVLFNITGASVCRSTIVPNDVLPARVNQHVSILRASQNVLMPKFLVHLITSSQIKSNLLRIGSGGGAIMEAITKDQLEKFQIIVPPIQLQKDFEVRISLVAEQKICMKKSLEKSEQLFQSLLQKAFKGELTSNTVNELSTA